MRHTPALPRTSLPARRHWAAWLVVALLWAQGLGVWHHTVHAPGLKAVRTASAAPAGVPAVSATAATAATVTTVTASDYSSPLYHAANTADCRLLDQLLLADGLATPAPAPAAVPPVFASAPCALVAQVALAASRPYLARAPPALS